ncbi:MAG: ABC transporter substrate-binding protein [Candidatus Rokubacteria bacterium]|nr:ABC transporter substrate-binding protein [Candidatus Rokubacteria bacterium]
MRARYGGWARWFGIAPALVVAAALVGGTPPAGAQENVLNVGKYSALGTYDPHAGDLSTLWWTLNNFYEGLLDFNEDLSGHRPVLATSWRVSPDGTSYTFTLRQGVKFSDGAPFDSTAVKLSVERAQALKKAAYLYVKPVVKVDTPAPTTVVFHLERPNNAFLPGLRFLPIVSPQALRDHDQGDGAQNWLRDHTAGTGPYVLERWEPNIIHVAKRNPLYWRGFSPNRFTTVNLRHIYEPGTQRLMIEKGELDIAENVTKDALPALKQNPDLVVYEKAGTSLMVTFLNTQAGPTKDFRVRQAIHHLWNQEAFDAITGHAANPGPLYAPLLGKTWRMENPYPYNPARAKQLLAEAGYGQGGFTLRFQSQKGDVDKRAIFEIFQAELVKLGIRMEFFDDTWPALVKRATDWGRDKDPNTAIHMMAYFRPAFTLSPYEFLLHMYHTDAYPTKGGRNFTYYTNPEYDRLINEAIVLTEPERELKLLRQAAEMVWKDAAVVVNGRIVDKIVMRKDVKGFIYMGDRISYRYYDMYRER